MIALFKTVLMYNVCQIMLHVSEEDNEEKWVWISEKYGLLMFCFVLFSYSEWPGNSNKTRNGPSLPSSLIAGSNDIHDMLQLCDAKHNINY